MKNLRIELKRELLKNYDKKINPVKYFRAQSYQKEFFDSLKRNKNVFGGNRSGKTECGAAHLIDLCLNNPSFDTWAATWADLSVPVQQKKIYNLLPKNKLIRYAKWTEQRGFANRIILFDNNSIMRFKTYDQGRESFQGTDKDAIWLDEEPKEEIVNECMARLIDRNGLLIRTMTPLNGITYTYDKVVLNETNDPEVDYWFWDSSMNEYVDQDALTRIIGNYAEKEAKVRKKGHFLNLTTGVAYYAFGEHNVISEFDFDFDRMSTVKGEFQYMPTRPLEISCDFNVDLMSWGIAQEHQGKDYQFDFVELERHANTQLMCQTLKNKYAHHSGSYIFYGDISGNQRHPEASRTNWAIIRDEFPNAEIYYQNIANIKDRVDSTNARFKNALGEINAFITYNCKRHTKDFRRVTWEHLLNKGHKDVKSELLTHASDGETYKFHWKYNLKGKPKTTIGHYA